MCFLRLYDLKSSQLMAVTNFQPSFLVDSETDHQGLSLACLIYYYHCILSITHRHCKC